MKRFFLAKALLFTFLVLLLGSLLIVGCPKPTPTTTPASPPTQETPTPSLEPIVIKVCHDQPPTHWRHHMIVEMQNYLDEALGAGRVKLDIHPGGSLYQGKDAMEACRSGTIQIAYTAILYMQAYDIAWSCATVPFVFDSQAHLRRFYESENGGGALSRLIESKGLTAFFGHNTGTIRIYTDKLIKTPDDFNGLKIRGMPGGELDVLGVMGAMPAFVPAPEVVSGLQEGVFDGVTTNPGTAYTTYRVDQLVKYIWQTTPPHLHASAVLVGNFDFWQNLPEDVREAMENEVIPRTWEWGESHVEENEEACLNKLVEGGMEHVVLSEEETAPFIELAQPVIDEYLAKIPPEIVAEIERTKAE